MELRVESAEGQHLPNDCYVGIRIGDVLKQGRYEPNRCYHFPQVERRRNAKIDIYQHVGSCVVAIDPDSTKSSHEVKVRSVHSSFPGATLKVNMQSRSEDAAKQQRADMAKGVKSLAKDYLSRYRIEERLAEGVKAMLKAQPEDPIEFLCRHLGGSPPVKTAQAEQTTYAQVDGKPATLSKNDDQGRSSANTAEATKTLQDPAAQSGTKEDSKPAALHAAYSPESALRVRAAHLMTQAAQNGELEKALRAAKADSSPSKEESQVAVSKAKVAQAFEEAAESGVLKQILMEVVGRPPKEEENARETARSKAARILMEAAENGSLEKAVLDLKTARQPAQQHQQQGQQPSSQQQQQQQQPDADAVRTQAAALMKSAAEDGSLKVALNQVKATAPAKPSELAAAEPSTLAQPSELAAAEPSTSGMVDAQALRARAASLMQSAAVDGSLKVALNEVKTKEPSQVAMQERSDRVLSQDEKKHDGESIRIKTAKLLFQAQENGELEVALRQIQEDGRKQNAESIRMKAANMLLQSAENGELETFLRQIQEDKKTQHDETIRMKTASLLRQAQENGELESALIQVLEDERKQNAENIRTKAANLLLQAEENGELEASCRQIQEDKKKQHGENIRMKIANLLVQAQENGELEAALRQTKGEAKPSQSDNNKKKDKESVRMKASNLLTMAIDNGDLETTLKQVKQETRERQSSPMASDTTSAAGPASST